MALDAVEEMAFMSCANINVFSLVNKKSDHKPELFCCSGSCLRFLKPLPSVHWIDNVRWWILEAMYYLYMWINYVRIDMQRVQSSMNLADMIQNNKTIQDCGHSPKFEKNFRFFNDFLCAHWQHPKITRGRTRY